MRHLPCGRSRSRSVRAATDSIFVWSTVFHIQTRRSKCGNRTVAEKFIQKKAPHGSQHPLVVPKALQEDYNEACLVIADSPKASAALSRRCLQNILRDHERVKHQNLNKEIDEAVAANRLPSHLAGDLHAIRVVGNFAAHPTKDTSTGEIVEVEPGEAEWLLNLLDGLFDFYFVAPAEAQKRRDALNAKLTAAGKPPI